MSDQFQIPMKPRDARRRARRAHAQGKQRKALKVLAFAQELNLAGVSAKAKTKSIITQFGVTTREARLAIKLAKPKKNRKRS